MTKKLLKYGLLLPLAGLLLASCEEQILNKFEETPSLWFYRGTSNNRGAIQRDSVNYSFFLAGSKTEDIVWLDVRLTGALSDKDRALSIVQTNAGKPNAAVAGRDYKAFDSPEMLAAMVMPANSTWASIPIMVQRTASMDTEEFRLDLAIASNEYFVEGINDKQIFTIKITAKASQPATWENIVNNGYFITFGAWGQEKMRFIIDYVGYTNFDEALTLTDLWRFYNLKARSALETYLLTNPPLYEADNTEVVFPQY